MLSYFGRAAYNYKMKYLFEFSLRWDGSAVTRASTGCRP